jgi:phosphatidate cytidylyltransferase
VKQRIVTGVTAGIAFLGLTFVGGWAYACLLILLALIGYFEFIRLNGLTLRSPHAVLGLAAMLVIVFPWRLAGIGEPSAEIVIWSLMFALLAITVVSKNSFSLDGAALLLLGAIYVGYGFSEMIEVRSLEPHGLFLTVMAFGCIWASDIGAYFVGRAIGKHKLWPSISPNKTVEGALGGIVLSLVVGVCFYLSASEWISLDRALLIGVVASIAGQLGDLIESAYKRIRNVKDSGRLLPGHGGVLDRCDSWLIVFPLLSLTGLLP